MSAGLLFTFEVCIRDHSARHAIRPDQGAGLFDGIRRPDASSRIHFNRFPLLQWSFNRTPYQSPRCDEAQRKAQLTFDQRSHVPGYRPFLHGLIYEKLL